MAVRSRSRHRLPALARLTVAQACLVILVSGLVGGCSSALRWEPEKAETPQTHTVKEGDTLYAIAWRHNLDWQKLAAWNKLDNGDLIYPGQRLRLYAPTGQTTAQKQRPESSTAKQPQKTPATASKPKQPAPVFEWPADGPVVAAFGDASSIGEGLDIGGVQGAAVKAAGAGKVVYVGSGLIGYGKLIIVKHNETYLSAYGHNRVLLVSQGDEIVSGQHIAQMGEGPGNRPLLHFEIRVNGQPVDPALYLPRR